MTRQKIGYVFLLLTILVLVVALNRGGLWWAGVLVLSGVTLWGTGSSSSQE